MGVRNSWLMFARKALLATFAASAASFALASATSARLRSCTSRPRRRFQTAMKIMTSMPTPTTGATQAITLFQFKPCDIQRSWIVSKVSEGIAARPSLTRASKFALPSSTAAWTVSVNRISPCCAAPVMPRRFKANVISGTSATAASTSSINSPVSRPSMSV